MVSDKGILESNLRALEAKLMNKDLNGQGIRDYGQL